MVAKSDKEKVKTLLSETIRLLCKNGLQFKAEFCVEALVGITLDQDEEFFLSIKETVKSDIVSSTRESSPPPHRKSKSDRKSREVHVKTDVSPSSCQRKRISDREPTESGDFQQDVGQSYWGNSSVHGEDSGGGNTPRKRRHIQTTQEDDSNPQIVIKGEPDSDSDIEEVASTSQDDHSLGAMPGTFGGYLPAPDQSYLDNVSSQPLPQQVWDQLPPFSSLPGTSAVPTTPSTMASGAGHSQMSAEAGDFSNEFQVAKTGRHITIPAIPSYFRQLFTHIPFVEVMTYLGISTIDELKVLRTIFLTKGSSMFASQIGSRYNNKNRPPMSVIHGMVKYCQERNLVDSISEGRVLQLIKKTPQEIDHQVLMHCGISLEQYESAYNQGDRQLVGTEITENSD